MLLFKVSPVQKLRRINMFFMVVPFLLLYSCEKDTYKDEDPSYETKRKNMVREQIERRGVTDSATLHSMQLVKRHLFVPQNLVEDAYDDRPLPIGYGQTISQPYIVAYMTELIQPKQNYKVLEIGTGSGYQAAVLAEIIDSVFTIEIIPELENTAAERINHLGYKNVKVKIGDGYYGIEESAPFDAIIVTAASEYIPPPLIEQLKDGGKMIIPIGSPFMVQMLMLVEKDGEKITTENLLPVRFVPFRRSN
jgi:protein-L-isoaspartate(D-aspartate) O-methyltransferase